MIFDFLSGKNFETVKNPKVLTDNLLYESGV